MAAFMATSCSQEKTYDEDWAPGEVSTAPGIFFLSQTSLISIDKDVSTTYDIPVGRMTAGEELTVPLVVNCDDANLVVPTSVTFESGKDTSAITIDVTDLQLKKQTPLSITFPAEYINPYAAGGSVLEANVVASGWEKINNGEGVVFSYVDWSYNPYPSIDPLTLQMYHLGGTDRYRIENFMNSGMDFTFDLTPSPYPAWQGYYRIIPLDHQIMTSTYGYNSYYNDWWFADEETENWPEYNLTSGGSPVLFYGTTYYWYDDTSSNEYCFVRRQGAEDTSGTVATYNTAYMGCFAYTDEDWTKWTPNLRLFFEWTDPE